MKTIALSALAYGGGALAHPGHGLDASHWHAADAVGLLVVALVVVATWVTARKK